MNWIFRNLIVCSILSMGVFSFLFFSETGELPGIKEHWEGFLLAILFTNLGGVAFYYINKQFNLSLPWNQKRSLRFAAETLSGLVIFSILGVLFYYIYIGHAISLDEETTFWSNYWDGVVKFGILLVVMVYLFSLVNFSMFSYNQYTVVQIDRLSHEREQIKLQFEALRSQLNPHFLFNSLNTISSLTYRDITMAEDYIRKLAETYRYILKTEDRKLVLLKEELDMVHSFFYMQKIKYEDCISLNIAIPHEIEKTLIPPLTIQMLIENALKHNLICEEKHLTIDVQTDHDKIIVKNNLIEKPTLLRLGNDVFDRPKENNSHKIGLENIKKRYQHFGKTDIEIVRNDSFIVKLPIIEKGFEE